MTSQKISASLSWILCVAMLAAGIGSSAYLLVRTLKLQHLNVENGGDVCSTAFGVSCDATLRSPLAHQLGIPLAGWGLVYFGGLGVLFALGYWLRANFLDTALLTALLATILTLPISAALVLAMLLGFASVCPLCVAIHTINAMLPFALIWTFGPPRGRIFRQVRSGLRFLLSKDDEDGDGSKWPVIGLLCAALASLAMYQAVMIQEQLHQPKSEERFWQRLLEYKRSDRVQIPIADDNPRLGPAEARVQLIVFSDFRCLSCQRFAPILHSLHSEFGDQLTIVFKHFPQEAICNLQASGNQHPGACQAALIAQAANNQGQFWQTHDQLFRGTDPVTGISALEIANSFHLDPVPFSDALQSEATQQRIDADIQDGQVLKIAATPAVFLNGVRLNDVRPETLRGLIALAAVRRDGADE